MIIALAAAIALGPGCFLRKSEPAPNQAAAITGANGKVLVTPDTALAGKVVRVNPTGRFVVLNFPVGRLPLMESAMDVYRQGLKVGEVRITGPQLDDNIVADLVKGEARPGDEIRNP